MLFYPISSSALTVPLKGLCLCLCIFLSLSSLQTLPFPCCLTCSSNSSTPEVALAGGCPWRCSRSHSEASWNVLVPDWALGGNKAPDPLTGQVLPSITAWYRRLFDPGQLIGRSTRWKECLGWPWAVSRPLASPHFDCVAAPCLILVRPCKS